MEPVIANPSSKSDNAALGILAGLGIGLGVAMGCVFLFILLMAMPTDAWYSNIVGAVPFLLPPAIVLFIGLNARRKKKNKFAAGLFIAAAVVALLEGTCGVKMFGW